MLYVSSDTSACWNTTCTVLSLSPPHHLHRPCRCNNSHNFLAVNREHLKEPLSYYSSDCECHCWGHLRDAAKNIAGDLIWPCVTRSRDEGRTTYCSSQFLFCFVLFRRGSRLWLSNEPFWNEASVTCVCRALKAIGGLRTICLSLGWVMCVCVCLWLQPGPGWSHQSLQPWGRWTGGV